MASGAHSSAGVHGLLIAVTSVLQSTGSRVHGLRQSRHMGLAVRGVWEPSGSGIKPVSPALPGGFPTT